MKTRISTLLLAALLPCAFGHAIDFTPRYRDVLTPSGDTAKRLYFDGDDGKYTLFAPADANMRGEGSALRFTFDTLESSTLVFRRSPLKPEIEFGDEAYRKALVSLLPATASEITVLEEDPNALGSAEWQSHRYLLSCKLPGNTLRVEVLFINLTKEEQIAVITTAYSEVFKAARAAAAGIIRTWSPVSDDELALPPAS